MGIQIAELISSDTLHHGRMAMMVGFRRLVPNVLIVEIVMTLLQCHETHQSQTIRGRRVSPFTLKILTMLSL